MDKTTFLKVFSDPVQRACSGTGIFPSVCLAQLALETGWGDSIKTAANNCFGIKAGANWPGKVISNSTHETIGGTSQFFEGTGEIYDSYAQAVEAGAHEYTLFKAYNDIAESIADHSNLLLNADRYQDARNADTPQNQAKAIQRAGYATGANYASILISIIRTNNLTEYDNKPGQ